jgi:hypothetical protein
MLVQGGFVTPSKNIACNVGKLGARSATAPYGIGCVVYSKASSRGNAIWWMRRTGSASQGYMAADPATDVPKLAYGRTFTWRGIRCTSATTGLTCKNASGHGFFLSRERQRIF